jgi:hypothetical protein
MRWFRSAKTPYKRAAPMAVAKLNHALKAKIMWTVYPFPDSLN